MPSPKARNIVARIKGEPLLPQTLTDFSVCRGSKFFTACTMPVAVARASNTPQPSRCHSFVHFRVFSQHLGAIPGRDRNCLCGNLFAIAASLAVQGGAVAGAKTVQEILRDLPRLH